MKTVAMALACVAGLLLNISCKKHNIEVAPVVSDKYSPITIDSLLHLYGKIHTTDIRPTNNMRDRFFTDFPLAKNIDWEANDDIYEIEFEIGNYDYKAYYDKQLDLILYKCEMDEMHLPAVVKNASVAIYPDYHFEEITKIVYASQVIYRLELERSDIEKIIFLKSDGSVYSTR